MLCFQPNSRWKKNITRCSCVINIVIIIIINNIPHWLGLTLGTSGAHMLGMGALAARCSPVFLHTCKRGTLLLALRGMGADLTRGPHHPASSLRQVPSCTALFLKPRGPVQPCFGHTGCVRWGQALLMLLSLAVSLLLEMLTWSAHGLKHLQHLQQSRTLRATSVEICCLNLSI